MMTGRIRNFDPAREGGPVLLKSRAGNQSPHYIAPTKRPPRDPPNLKGLCQPAKATTRHPCPPDNCPYHRAAVTAARSSRNLVDNKYSHPTHISLLHSIPTHTNRQISSFEPPDEHSTVLPSRGSGTPWEGTRLSGRAIAYRPHSR
jgi:hypothetical protein